MTSKVSKAPLKGRMLSLTQISPLDPEATLCQSNRAERVLYGSKMQHSPAYTWKRLSRSPHWRHRPKHRPHQTHLCSRHLSCFTWALPPGRPVHALFPPPPLLLQSATFLPVCGPTNLGISLNKAQRDKQTPNNTKEEGLNTQTHRSLQLSPLMSFTPWPHPLLWARRHLP